MKRVHVVGLAGAAAALLSLAYAEAQAPKAFKMPPGVPKMSASAMAARGAGGLRSTDERASAFVLGWNFRVCSQSRSIIEGPSHVMLALNTDGSGFFYTSPSENATQHNLWAACQHGGAGYWIYITNVTTLAFSEVAVNYP